VKRGSLRQPRVHDVEGEEAADAVRRTKGEEEADPAAPVVAGEVDALDLERVEDAQDIARHLLLEVALLWRVRPAEAAEVEG
jgi:hypothetical protein